MAAYISVQDLSTHLYAEIIAEITRDDDDIAIAAIAEAVGLAKSYLSRFNLTKLFNPDAVGFVNDATLKAKVKDLAIWNTLRLSNANIQMDIAEKMNDNAIAWIKDISSGKADPEGWPYKDDDADTTFPEGSAVSITTNLPRNNHY